MANNSADELFSRTSRSQPRYEGETRSRSWRGRTPSSAGYMLAAIILAGGLGVILWWMLATGGDEAPWLTAGLAVSLVLLVALSAREVVMRRAWTKYLLEHGIPDSSKSQRQPGRSQKKGFSASLHSSALRAIQKQSVAADSSGSTPEAHFDVAQLCHDYLARTEEAMRSGSLGSEKGIAIRAGQERVRALHRHHLLSWARGHSLALTRDAQLRARTFDKIETANRALECLDSTLRIYPDEQDLRESKTALYEFIASVKVAHWVELAERSAFKGHYRRAMDRYRDALFYLNQDVVKEEVRTSGSERIEKEIARLKSALQDREPGNSGQRSAAENE